MNRILIHDLSFNTEKEGKMTKRHVFVITVLLSISLMVLGSGLALGEDFNWRKYEGTTIRALLGKSAFTPIQQKHVKEF